MVLGTKNNLEFNKKIRDMLWMGVLCHLGFSFAAYFACNRDPRVFWIYGILSSLMFINASFIGSARLNLQPTKGTSYLMAINFFLTLLSITLSCHITNWPAGSFVAILIICLALMEVSFIFNDLIRRVIFFLIFLIGLGVFLFANDPLNMRQEFAIGFSMISAWKFLNLFYLKKFLNNYANEVKLEAYLNYMGTVKHEFNNTSTIILGLSRFMRKKPKTTIEDDLEKLDESIYRMLNQINSIDHFDGMNNLYKQQSEKFQNIH